MRENEDFDFEDLQSGNEESFTREKQEIDTSTFKLRNDPQEVLERFKLSLLGLFKNKKIITDEDGNTQVQYIIKKKNYVNAMCNRQGAEDIINYIEKSVNGHTVQSFMDGEINFKSLMELNADDITAHFMSKRDDWQVSIKDIDLLIASTINFIEFFLRRTIDNKERESYDVGFKETTSRDIKPREKESFLQKFAGFFNKGVSR
jgi:hypothetical protein